MRLLIQFQPPACDHQLLSGCFTSLQANLAKVIYVPPCRSWHRLPLSQYRWKSLTSCVDMIYLRMKFGCPSLGGSRIKNLRIFS